MSEYMMERDEEMFAVVEEEEEDEDEDEDEDEGFGVEEGEEDDECLYTVVEEVVDFDYEFDASKFFDLSREETPIEAREAESWFQRAPTYPPSPFAARLDFEEDIVPENINLNGSAKPEAENLDPAASHLDTDMRLDTSVRNANCGDQEGPSRGAFGDLQTSKVQYVQSETQIFTKSSLTFYNHIANDIPKAKPKSAKKASLSRGSTLMKPTASQLAKQNRREVHAPNQLLGRYQKPLNQRSIENPTIDSQASKRQKLEGGHLRKVADSKPQTNFAHKEPKKGISVDGNLVQNKLKLTIPREPDLETAHRAQRTRSKNNIELGERANSIASMFRARPLNRKILQAPSLPPPKKSTPRVPEFQAFHLKTSERAMQHSSAVSSATQPSNKSEKLIPKTKAISITENGTVTTRPNPLNAQKQEGCEQVHKFKARPFNKKIFSSKGDIGVFRNSKREATVPMEFKFSTDKRSQYHPPVELFNKLSLTSELRQKTISQQKSTQLTCLPSKDSKENTLETVRQGQRITRMVKEKSQRFGGSQMQCGVDGDITEIGSRANMSRSLGIR